MLVQNGAQDVPSNKNFIGNIHFISYFLFKKIESGMHTE